jgi:phosphohistidine phosphatase
MRSLTLLRHAEASWGDDAITDFVRPLNERGWQAAQAMGRHLATRGARFDRIVASSAQRVVETLQGLAAGGWEPENVSFELTIYNASMVELLEIVRSCPDDAERVMLVGHNPGIGMLAVQLTSDDADGRRSRLADGYPAGALAEIELDVEVWRQAAPHCGRLIGFTVPSMLPEA